jgi:hypothetical protein
MMLAVTSSVISAVTAFTSNDCQDLHTWAQLVKHVLLLLLLLPYRCTANAAVAPYHAGPLWSSLLFIAAAGS